MLCSLTVVAKMNGFSFLIFPPHIKPSKEQGETLINHQQLTTSPVIASLMDKSK